MEPVCTTVVVQAQTECIRVELVEVVNIAAEELSERQKQALLLYNGVVAFGVVDEAQKQEATLLVQLDAP